MEIQFQQQQHHQGAATIPVSKVTQFKGRYRNKKFVGVRQRPSGRWVAEIKDTTQKKIRMWLGTFESAEEAACAYDEAACLLRGSNTRTNFSTNVSANSPIASRIRNLLNSKNGAKQERVDSFTTTTISSTSSCSSSCTGDHVSNGGDSLATQLFDDAYKPDLSNCSDEFELGSSQSGISWGFGPEFDRVPFNQELLDLPRNVVVFPEKTELELSEFDRRKVKRQITASPHDDPTESSFWDLYSLFLLN